MSERFVNIAVPPLKQLFTYSVPDGGAIAIGSCLRVSFGKQSRLGYVIEEVEAPATTHKIKELNLNQDIRHCFLPSQLQFLKWISSYYGVPLSLAIETALPKITSAKEERFIRFLKTPEKALRGKVQNELFEEIKGRTDLIPYTQLLKKHTSILPALRALQEKGLIEIFTQKKEYKTTITPPAWAKREVVLNEDQINALNCIKESLLIAKNYCTTCNDENGSALSDQSLSKPIPPFLMHGVTGSGKTEVYIEAINAAKDLGLGSLVIVPEIALTPQLIDRFTARLGNDIAILHSGISDRERWSAWSALLEGKIQIAIGARSGIFAPIQNLGLIIVDEEHDSSFKQSDGLRYNARDLAVVLASLRHCPVVLGSATPSLESYHNALTKKYRYLPLRKRHHSGSDIVVSIIDMNKSRAEERPSPSLSKELYTAITEKLAHKEQVFILYNRRGFACYLQCDKCNKVITCPNCSVTLTMHASDNTLKCHYCDYKIPAPTLCPHCTAEEVGSLILRGSGTEKVFEEIADLFPEAKLSRLDRDAADNPQQYRQILDDVRNGTTDILIGTQMIAKGHDLPKVTLVGIVDCDVGLNMPDFRASERVFQLLTQASGRAGRGTLQGRVLLQTHIPNHLSLQSTKLKSFATFAKAELSSRKELFYPPFSRILRVLVSSEDQQEPFLILSKWRDLSANLISKQNLAVSILGPCPTAIARIRNRWRWHLLFKSKAPSALNIIMNALQTQKVSSSTRIAFDLDPQDLL
ncbi:MAG: replication restart helicase PriA [Bdellovibrionota bacterium]|jgi:primosomal protein N' (replication factor Y)